MWVIFTSKSVVILSVSVLDCVEAVKNRSHLRIAGSVGILAVGMD